MDVPLPPFVTDLPCTRTALDLAVELHRGQRRESDAAPFILHPLEVAALLHGRGFEDQVVAAAVLHDVLEDTDAQPEDVEARLGGRVARLVAEVSEDPALPGFAERKAELRERVARAGPEAHAIFAADKVVKARELRAQATRDPAALRTRRTQERLAHYEATLAVLTEHAPDVPFLPQLRFELWALRHLPPESDRASDGE